MTLFLGIDVGTTSARAVLVDSRGRLCSEGVGQYGMAVPKPGWAEQNPDDWAKGVKIAVAVALSKAKKKPRHIAAVGLTGQMHSSVFLDKDDRVVRPAILWCDGRAGAECRKIEKKVGLKTLLAEASNLALPGFTAPKILWVKNHEPAAYRRVRKILVTKDYIRFLMTGAYATDVSDASGTLLLNVAKRRWSDKILKSLSISLDMLPDVFESTDVTGSVTREGARRFGLPYGTPVVGGGGDQAAGAIGNGIVHEGDATISLGTSGVVFAPSSKPPKATGSTVHAFCHAAPGMWHTMGVMLSAGGSVQWMRNLARSLDPKFSYDKMNSLAAKVAPGSDGLLFLPYLTGERTPHNDPDARGAFVGLNLSHDISHMSRAVFEGVSFGLRDCAESMKAAGASLKNVYLSGGGAKSKLWGAIVASVLKTKVKRLEVEQGTAFGAALLAGVGIGAWDDVPAAAKIAVKLKDEIAPNREWAGAYDARYAKYRSLYPALKGNFS